MKDELKIHRHEKALGYTFSLKGSLKFLAMYENEYDRLIPRFVELAEYPELAREKEIDRVVESEVGALAHEQFGGDMKYALQSYVVERALKLFPNAAEKQQAMYEDVVENGFAHMWDSKTGEPLRLKSGSDIIYDKELGIDRLNEPEFKSIDLEKYIVSAERLERDSLVEKQQTLDNQTPYELPVLSEEEMMWHYSRHMNGL